MPHLELERLAALDEDAPSSDELTHLAACVECRQEREAFARLAALSFAERGVAGPAARTVAPLTDWASLSQQLRAEGLLTRPSATLVDAERVDAEQVVDAAPRVVRATAPIGPAPRPFVSDRVGLARRGPSLRAIARLAAAVLLLVSGVAIGRVSAGAPLTGTLPRTDAAMLGESADASYRSTAEASLALEQAQRDYQRASYWLASHDTTVNAQAVYRARLAALDQMVTASRAGLYEAPQDPMLNQYYLAAYTAREATLRQLGAALPVDRVMERF